MRVEKCFKEEMQTHDLEVLHVTIGRGYNDITNILESTFDFVENPE